ncbi:MAG: hypothetical protein ACO29O_00575 [Chitinophagaceae bacterium]
MNLFVIAIVCMTLVGLMVFLIRRNVKDEKKFEKDLNQDYPHATDRPSDIEMNDTAN